MAQVPIDPVLQGMKKTEITIPLIEGFPFESETVKWMQESYTLLSVLGEIVGDKAIIKGCSVTGNSVSAGYIYIGGELLFFKGGQTQATIVIIEEVIQREWEDGTMRDTYKRRHAEFGIGVTQYNWDEFNRVDPIIMMMQKISNLEKKTAVFQADGGMLFWNKPVNEIPAGWQEVVDWRGRMPVGMDTSQVEFDTLGKTGGQKDVTLTEAEMPIHKHTGSTNSDGGHTPTGTAAGPYIGTDIGGGFQGGDHNFKKRPVEMDPLPNHSHVLNMNNKGGGQPHSNLSPYRVALFIEYIED